MVDLFKWKVKYNIKRAIVEIFDAEMTLQEITRFFGYFSQKKTRNSYAKEKNDTNPVICLKNL